MLTTHLRRVGAALAAAAIGLPALAITTASAEPVLDPPLTAAAGTSWTDGPCEVGAGVTVVVDMQGDAEAGVHCVTNEDGTAYSSPNALQTFADAGFAVETETTTYGPMICKVEGAPDPCGQWPGAWWGFYTADADAAWTMAGAGAHDTAAATDTFVGLSLVPEDSAGIEPRADTALLEDETPGDDEPAEERGDDEPADADAAVVAAADFLSRELQAQDHLFVNHGFNDYGLTADFALALAATGLNSEDAASAGQQVTANILEYIGTDGERYAGATAKSAVLALSLGMDSTDFGGVDLIAALQDLETESGRFSDVSEWGDYSNTLGQSLAIIALEGAGVGASQSAVDYLLDAQCDDGGFALTPTDGTCLSDPDATSFALQALLATPCATDASIDDALGYLVGRQQESGGLGGGQSTESVNANSTGLAGAVFATVGLDDAAKKAAGFLANLQYGSDFASPLVGGIAYDESVLAARADADAVADQDRRATAQAVLGLAGITYAELAGAETNAPERQCRVDGSVTPPAAPPVAGPVVETDIVAETGTPVALLAVLATLLLLAGGGAVAANARRGTHL